MVTYISPAETGLYYLQSRYYDPGTGRFINADSVVASVGEVQGNNLFAYCDNNPINNSDPSGHWKLPNWAKVVIGVVAVAAAVVLTVATGGALAPLLIGVAISTIAGAAIGAATGGIQGAIDGACDGFMWGGIGALASSVVGAVKAVQVAKQGVTIGRDMGKVKAAAEIVDTATYKPMPAYKLVKTVLGENVADNLSFYHNANFINRMIKLGSPIYDSGLNGFMSAGRWYGMELSKVSGYWNYVKMY